MTFDASDLEADRRAHDYEMGSAGELDRSWSRFYNAAEREIIAKGWDGKFDSGKSRGLDGAELPDDDDGYSIDGAYDAWERGLTVTAYIARVAVRRSELGL